MYIFLEEHKNFLYDLISAEIEFVLVGGYAVNYYGYNRSTGDMDLFIKPDNKLKPKIFEILKKNNISIEGLALFETINLEETTMFSIWEPPYKIDFLTRINNVSFEEAWTKKNLLPLKNKFIGIINYDHLILSKFSTTRLKDKLDIEELQKINK